MRAKKVLFITADQWRGEALGCLGHPAALTPNLDALARDGVLFRNHFTCAAPCGPARTTLLTGLYPFIHRSVRNGTPLDRRFTNIAWEARASGRTPVLFGYTDSSADPRALHPADPRLKTFEGVLPGFQVEVGFNEGCLEPWILDLRKKGYHLPETLMAVYEHPNARGAQPHFSAEPALYRAEDSDTAFLADKVLDYLSMRRKDDWFIHAVFLRPHPPIIAPAPYNRLVDPSQVPKPKRHATPEAEAASHPYLMVWLQEQNSADYFQSQVNLQTCSEADREALRAVYYGLIAEVDYHIGRIIQALKDSGEYDETLIIFTSDHGEMLGDHWAWGKGGYFDASNHIPLIIRAPERAARGQLVSHFTESVDLMPTILEWMGSEVPMECNGHSLLPWIDGIRPESWRRFAFWEFDFRNPATSYYEQALGLSPDECTLNVLRDEQFKYVHFTSLPPLLFDLQADPAELVNLAADPAFAGTVSHYAQRLLSHRMLHAERSMTNAILTPQGVVQMKQKRGMPPHLFL